MPERDPGVLLNGEGDDRDDLKGREALGGDVDMAAAVHHLNEIVDRSVFRRRRAALLSRVAAVPAATACGRNGGDVASTEPTPPADGWRTSLGAIGPVAAGKDVGRGGVHRGQKRTRAPPKTARRSTG